MSSALLTLLQTSLFQPVEDAKKGVAPVREAPPGLALAPAAAETRGGDFAAALRELVTEAKELARIDQMLTEAEASAPKGAEAQQWHEVSLRAIGWSRDSVAARQGALLAKMKAIVRAQAGAAAEPEGERVPAPVRAVQAHQLPQPVKSLLSENAKEFVPMKKEFVPLSCIPSDVAHLVGSLRADLEQLRAYDPEAVIFVKKVKTLGIDSPAKLEAHFARYGAVSKVFAAHSFEKPSAKRRNGRIRPAALAFVIMQDPTMAQELLAMGEAHKIQDGGELVEVTVHRFEVSDVEADF